MLSRIAESLYWIGRYVERAEDTCRILDVHLQLGVDDPATQTQDSAAALLSVLGMKAPDGPVSPEQVMQIVEHDKSSSASVLSSLHGARESARRARETVPPELWESLNMTWNAVRAGQLNRMRPVAGLAFVRERCALISGVADTTMSHDEGWLFMQLGRSLERIDMSSRLMMWAASTKRPQSSWNNALRACGAMHAYRRTHGGAPTERHAAEFLLLDRLFPRSIVYSLNMAEDALTELEPGLRRAGFQSEAVRLLGRARAELEYQTMSEVLTDLPGRLAHLQSICAAVDAAITHRYFLGEPSPAWSGGAV